MPKGILRCCSSPRFRPRLRPPANPKTHLRWHPSGLVGRSRPPLDRAPVAAVAAETAHAAEDALAAIVVMFETLPAVADQEAAIEEGAVRLHDAAPIH